MIDVSEQVASVLPYGVSGRVSRIVGLTLSVVGLPVPVGSRCEIVGSGRRRIEADVVGFRDGETLLLPSGPVDGVAPGDHVELRSSSPTVAVGRGLLGRVVDAHGRVLDGEAAPALPHRTRLDRPPTAPLSRPRIDTPLGTGVRAIDGLLTCGRGQRLGIFAGSGVGKSTLLGQMARSTTADVNVVVLVGERGREVREFLERDLGPDGLARSVVVVATGDEPALARIRAARFGTAIAESFRDEGLDVLLVMDSVTRFALAMREVGLAAGEPPATRGYPPSVFAALPRLLERSGRTDRGSITAFYTVLVEADDTNEPIADTVRGILDGHVVLSRKLGERGHWPAIDVLQSVSRSMNDVVTPAHREAAGSVRELLAAYEESRDLVEIGAYQQGTNERTDTAIRMRDAVETFLRQTPDDSTPFDETAALLAQLHAERHPATVPTD